MSLKADLYLDRMDLSRYFPEETCELCKVDSLSEFIGRIKAGGLKGGACPHWPAWKVEAFRQAVDAGVMLPEVPSLELPRPARTGVMELVETDASSPVLVTGNSEYTHAVMLTILATTSTPIRMLSVDCLGHTVDMAIIFREFKAEKIAKALSGMEVAPEARIVIPGLAASLAREIDEKIGRAVEVGPVCAAELPLFMGEDWKPTG